MRAAAKKFIIVLQTGLVSIMPLVAPSLALGDDVLLGGVQLWENGPYWAECNVGATKPEDFGYYFWWGDIVGYVRAGGTYVEGQGYFGVTWKSSNNTNVPEDLFSSCPADMKTMSKLQTLGYVDTDGNLVPENDAATKHLGAPWRMPTTAELLALVSNCDTAWTTRNGVHGRLVTGRGAYSSKSIFLPAAGFACISFGESNLYNPDAYGYYWSSSACSGNSLDTWGVFFYSGFFMRSSPNGRYCGQSVRAVRTEGDSGAEPHEPDEPDAPIEPHEPGDPASPVAPTNVTNYIAITVTNVVIQYVFNSIQPNVAVPQTADKGYVNVLTEIKGGAVAVPSSWADNYPRFREVFGDDFAAALTKTIKNDGSGNPIFVWQDFVAGTDPTDADSKFVASITLVGGEPVVSWSPELKPEQAALRKYTVYGKAHLYDEKWSVVDGDAGKYGFFKVAVEMR